MKVATPASLKKSPVKLVKANTPARASPRKSLGKVPMTPKKMDTPNKTDTPKKTPIKTTTPAKATPKQESVPKVTPAKTTPRTARKAAATGLAPMVETPPRGPTPQVKTPRDEVLDSPDNRSPKKNVPYTPKGQKAKVADITPKSATKVTKTPKMVSKTPKVVKPAMKPTLWSEVVRKNLGKTPRKKVTQVVAT